MRRRFRECCSNCGEYPYLCDECYSEMKNYLNAKLRNGYIRKLNKSKKGDKPKGKRID